MFILYMSEEYYRQKYLKYKIKYLDLQEQMGGLNPLKYIPFTGSYNRHKEKKENNALRNEKNLQNLTEQYDAKIREKNENKKKRINDAINLIKLI